MSSAAYDEKAIFGHLLMNIVHGGFTDRRKSPKSLSPIIQPASYTNPIFSRSLPQYPIQRVDGFIQVHTFLERKNDASMMGITLPKDDEVANVIRENGATLSSRAKQLLLIAGIEWHPLSGRSCHIMAEFEQRVMQGFAGGVRIKMQM